jgi:hypothetical protein
MALEDRRNSELLDGSGIVISAELNVLQHGGMNATSLEVDNRIDLGWSLLLDVDAVDSVK